MKIDKRKRKRRKVVLLFLRLEIYLDDVGAVQQSGWAYPNTGEQNGPTPRTSCGLLCPLTVNKHSKAANIKKKT